MNALTIRQPWASLIAAGVKTIETRSWSTKYRGPLAIHAGTSKPKRSAVGDWLPCEQFNGSWVLEHYARGCHGAPGEIPMPIGAVVATCTLADVVPIVHVDDEDCDMDCVVVTESGIHLDLFRGAIFPMDEQLPFGDFTPGRYAFLLTDITPLPEPQPAKGRQGLWDWEADRG